MTKTKKIFYCVLKEINWKLLIIIFFFQFFPTLYKTTRIFFLGNLPDENSFNIASQILWLNILYEIITESIVIPVFYLFSKWKDKSDYKKIYTLIFIFVFAIYFLFTIIIFFNIDNILKTALGKYNEIFIKSSEYIKFEVWGFFLYSIFSYLFLTTTIFRFNNYIIVNIFVCLIYSLLTCLFDLFFITNFDFSLKLSVKGIGINSIIVNAICSIIFVIYLSTKKIKIWDFKFSNVQMQKCEIIEYIKLFIFSCIEVSIRNMCFFFMVVKPINSLNDQGIYWITNNFIWSWLLLPISTLSTYIKETFILNEGKNKFIKQIAFYVTFTTFVIFIWFLFSPINSLFIKNILGVKDDYAKISKLTFILLPFYVAFAYGLIVDSILIKEGKINYYCIQSLFVNLTVYPIYFILWKLNIWVPTLNSVCIMFCVGMVVHFIVNIPIFYLFIKKQKIFLKLKNA